MNAPSSTPQSTVDRRASGGGSAVRVVFYYHLALEFPEEISRMAELFPDVHFDVVESDEEFHAALPEATVIVAAPQPSTTLDRSLSAAGSPRSLQAHIIPFAGVNRVPLSWYRQHGVLLASSHGNADAVAERAVALMYAAAGRVVEFDNDLRQGRWHRRDDHVRPFDYWRTLTGSRIAILGTGAIGCRIAALVAPLIGGRALAGDRAPGGSGGAGELVGLRRNRGRSAEEEHGGARVVTAEAVAAGEDEARHPERLFGRLTTRVEEALAGADVVFLTLPLTEDTRGTITGDLLGATNQATLVNVSRAELIPEEDLYASLTDGTLYAAGLDVWYRYPSPFFDEGITAFPSRLPFHHLRNVVMSPHAASHSREGKRSQLVGALAHLEEFLKTGGLSRAVNVRRGY